jgi:hypothetical protein
MKNRAQNVAEELIEISDSLRNGEITLSPLQQDYRAYAISAGCRKQWSLAWLNLGMMWEAGDAPQNFVQSLLSQTMVTHTLSDNELYFGTLYCRSIVPQHID